MALSENDITLFKQKMEITIEIGNEETDLETQSEAKNKNLSDSESPSGLEFEDGRKNSSESDKESGVSMTQKGDNKMKDAKIDVCETETKHLPGDKKEIILQIDEQKAYNAKNRFTKNAQVVKRGNEEKINGLYDNAKSEKATENGQPVIFTVGHSEKESKNGDGEIDLEHLQHIYNKTIENPAENASTGIRCERKWVVLMAAFISLALSTGFPFNMSVLYVEWLHEFEKSNSETSLVQSVCTGVYFTGGFISGIIVTKYGPFKCGVLGGILVTLGLCVSFLAESILHLVLCIGIISGFGFSLAYISASTCVGMFFNDSKQRLLALAFISLGSGVGSSIFPIALELLVLEFGWRGCVLIVGGMMFNLVTIACLFRKPQTKLGSRRPSEYVDSMHEQVEVSDDPKEIVESSTVSNGGASDKRNSTPNGTGLRRVSFSTTELRRMYEIEEDENKGKNIINVLKGILQNKIFISYCFAQALCISAFNSILIFLIDFYQFQGFSMSDAVLLYLCINIASTIFRFIPGFLKQLPHISVLAIPTVSSFLGFIATALLPVTGASFTFSIIVACILGVGLGGMVTVIAISIVKLVGTENYSAGLGIAMTVSGLFNASAGPISGFIRDSTGNYDMSCYTVSATLFLSSVFFLVTMVTRYNANQGKGSRFDFEMIIRKKSRRRSSIFPWRRKSVDIHL